MKLLAIIVIALSSILTLLVYLYEKLFADKSFNNRLLLNIGGIVLIILIAIQ